MNVENAFKIFTPQEIESLNEENLKQFKKEFMLQFQLTDESQVLFNGHKMDKDSVIKVFDFLRGSVDDYKKAYEGIIIDEFISSGNLSHLIHEGFGDHIIRGIMSLPQKREKLLFRLSEVIAQTITTPAENREEMVKKIRTFTEKLPTDYEEKAYSTAFRYLRNEIESIKSRYDNPFLNNFSLKLEPELNSMVDVRFLKLFQLLPEQFQFLAYEYSLWCQNFILELTQNREPAYHKYPINSLIVIRNAALIASEYYQEHKHLKISSHITMLLNDPEKLAQNDTNRFNFKRESRPVFGEWNDPWIQVFLFVILMVLLYFIDLLF